MSTAATIDIEAAKAEFRRMCCAHDLTYVYSDDSRDYDKGRESYQAIRNFIPIIGETAAATIWNSVCDAKLLPHCAPDFYWRLP